MTYRFLRERHSYIEQALRSRTAVTGIALHFPSGRKSIQLQFGDKIAEVQQTGIGVDADVLCRDDGFKLICLGHAEPSTRDLGQTFRYSKDGVTFDFAAGRALWRGAVTGACSISLFLEARMFGGLAPEIAKLQEIATDIDDALRAWPVPLVASDIPLGIVYFFVMMEDRTDGKFSFVGNSSFVRGQPVILRHTPCSERWELRSAVHPAQTSIRNCWPNSHRTSLIRDDGVQLIRIPTGRGPNNDGPDGFRYIDHGVAFDFNADYRFTKAHATDTWGVILDPPDLQGLSPALRAMLGPGRCAEIAGNIEEALYAWPLEKGHVVDMPINRVVFTDAPWE